MKFKLSFLTIAALLICDAGFASADASLVGRWQGTAIERQGKKNTIPAGMKMIAHFKKGGRMVSEMEMGGQKKRQEGTWQVDGKILTTKVGKLVEKMTFSVKGKALILRNIKNGQRLFMKKI